MYTCHCCAFCCFWLSETSTFYVYLRLWDSWLSCLPSQKVTKQYFAADFWWPYTLRVISQFFVDIMGPQLFQYISLPPTIHLWRNRPILPCCLFKSSNTAWLVKSLWHGTAVQCQSLAGELTLSHARPSATYVGILSAGGQPTNLTQLFIVSGLINEQ